jgi:predicted Zn finger-like uncharacterized protein
MNNACPNCGAVYAVTAKDIGRKIKCKKCSTALRVEDSGLVEDAPAAPPPPPSKASPALAAAVVDDEADEPVVSTKRGRTKQYSGGGGDNFVKKIGGIPTILFSVGLFLVLWFTFQSGPIAEAAIYRAKASPAKLQMEMGSEIEAAKGDQEKIKKIMESYEKKNKDATKEMNETGIDIVRGVKWDRYGQLFGFVLLAFGCVGYLRTEQLPVMHYAAAVILAGMLLAVFGQAMGCAWGGSSGALKMGGSSKGGGGFGD